MNMKTTVHDDILRNLIRVLEGKVPKVRVGIIGSKNNRKDSNSNATIGLKHEYGDSEVPMRSFLRMPITLKMQSYLDKSGLLEQEAIDKLCRDADFTPWIKQIGVVAESIVLDGFATGGFGQWKPHSPGYQNRTGQVLIDTQQLRNSITHEVVV